MAKVTIQDVARVAGVSVATVDRVLNRRPGVRGVTVNKVETAIRDLNYQPDRIAGPVGGVLLMRPDPQAGQSGAEEADEGDEGDGNGLQGDPIRSR
jgi:hypothetical protein